MKKIIFKWMLCLSLLGITNASFAQDTTSSFECDSMGESAALFPMDAHILTSKAPSLYEANKIFKTILKGDMECDSCPQHSTPPVCVFSIGNILSGNLVLSENGRKWCIPPLVLFEWSCGPCSDTTDVSDTTSMIQELLFSVQETMDSKERDGLGEKFTGNTSQWQFSPNPASGEVAFQLNTVKTWSRVALLARDMTGRLVYEKYYDKNLRDQINTRLDLSALEAGWYLFSVYLDGELLGTEKIVISK